VAGPTLAQARHLPRRRRSRNPDLSAISPTGNQDSSVVRRDLGGNPRLGRGECRSARGGRGPRGDQLSPRQGRTPSGSRGAPRRRAHAKDLELDVTAETIVSTTSSEFGRDTPLLFSHYAHRLSAARPSRLRLPEWRDNSRRLADWSRAGRALGAARRPTPHCPIPVDGLLTSTPRHRRICEA